MKTDSVMNKVNFRIEMYKTFVQSNMIDPVLIQEYILIAEQFVFENEQYTQSELNKTIERLSLSANNA